MAKTIWKYRLKFFKIQNIDLPQGAKCLLVGEQAGELTLWFEVNPKMPIITTLIHIIGTGENIPENVKHLGSTQIREYVWHIYIKISSEENI